MFLIVVKQRSGQKSITSQEFLFVDPPRKANCVHCSLDDPSAQFITVSIPSAVRPRTFAVLVRITVEVLVSICDLIVSEFSLVSEVTTNGLNLVDLK